MVEILVTYATRYGATRQIAQTIADQITQLSHEHVWLLPVDEVLSVDLYDAVIIGSPIYNARWMPAIEQFIQKFDLALQQRAVWLFSCGPTGEDRAVNLLHGWRYPQHLDPCIARIAPRDMKVFHGKIDFDALNWWQQLRLRLSKFPEGDFRHWDDVYAWSARIHAEITALPSLQPEL